MSRRECFVEMQFGSRVYGTALPSSDTDIKGIFLPTAEEILLQEVPKGTSERTNDSDSGKRNGPEDTDFEAFSLQRFCNLVMDGQTVAHDMLFTPDIFWMKGHKGYYDRWTYVREYLKNHALSRKVGAAVGYAKAQAERYSARGDRINELTEVCEWLRKFQGRTLLGEVLAYTSTAAPPSGRYIKHFERNGERYMEVCGKACGYQTTVYRAEQMWKKQLDEYGHRAREAASFSGADWKALYHALRIPLQTAELLTTGRITFPRPEAEGLLAIRRGELSYEEVSMRIEQATERLIAAQAKSILPEEPNRAAVRDLVKGMHKSIVTAG